MTPRKCPNPPCSFRFDPSQVPANAVIACPRCGQRFTLPSSTAPEVAENLSFASPGRAATTARPPEIESPPKRGVSLKAIVFACLAVMVIGGIALTVMVVRNNRRAEIVNKDRAYRELGLAFRAPDEASGWEKHDGLKEKFDARLFGYERTSAPGGWIVGDARRFEAAVRPSELKERMIEQLQRNFTELPGSWGAEPTTYLGQPGFKFGFRAVTRDGGAVCLGEVVVVALGPVGVWVYAYAGEKDFATLEGEFQAVRGGLKRAAAEGPSAARYEKTHRSKSGLFTLTDHEGLWENKADPESQEKDAQLWLAGIGKRAGKKVPGLAADVVVAVLEPDADPAAQARAHVLMQMNEGGEASDIIANPEGDPPSVDDVSPNAEVRRLRVRYPKADPSSHKLIVFAAAPSGGKLVVAYGIAPLADAEYWEQRLMLIVGSLKATR